MPTRTKPTRPRILELLAAQSRPIHARELASLLAIREADYLELLGLLEELAIDGAVRALPGQRFLASRTAPTASREGTILVHPRGFGFVASPGQEDVFIPAQSLGGAMHGDRVSIRVLARGRRGPEGAVIDVLDRAHRRAQGVLRRRGRSAWLEVDDPRIRGPIVLPSDTQGDNGQAAVVEFTRYPQTPDENPEAVLIACLGTPGEPDVETRKILLREQVDESFSAEVQAEASAHAAATLDRITLASRVDLRALPLLTIDPDDARDHDDAVWVARTDVGYDVCVAIADVAEYVREDTPLDREARKRAFSIYLPDRAVPMLPAALSSDACSLLEHQDRLCLAVQMRLDAAGRIRSTELVEAVMRSHASLTYSGVARSMKWTELDTGTPAVPDSLLEVIRHSDQLARLLRKKRIRRGSLELNVPEAHILLDPDSAQPIGVQRRAQDPGVRRAYQLIEELMLIANQAVAEWMQKRELHAVFRIHPPPDEPKLQRLANLCEALGIDFELEDATDPKRLGAFLARVAEHPLAEIIGTLALRSLKQASYDLINVGHFGLALQNYLHFTSPIRRYPDLLVHRACKYALRRGPAAKSEVPAWLRDAVEHCSKRERKVMEIEREVADLYRTVFMRSQIGLIAEGRVMEVMPSSVIVSLDEPFVDVRVSDEMLGRDSYEASDDGLAMVGRRSGDTVLLGDRMLVEIVDVNLARRSVTGRRVRDESGPARRRGRKAKPSGKSAKIDRKYRKLQKKSR